jgi:Tol biopolymer transport system component
VVYAAQRDGRWDLAVVEEGEPERLLGVNSGYTAYVRWPDWSPSGDRIAFEHTQMTADVWILPLRPAGPAAAGS